MRRRKTAVGGKPISTISRMTQRTNTIAGAAGGHEFMPAHMIHPSPLMCCVPLTVDPSTRSGTSSIFNTCSGPGSALALGIPSVTKPDITTEQFYENERFKLIMGLSIVNYSEQNKLRTI